MSDLIAVAFDRQDEAEAMLDHLARKHAEQQVDLEDACAVERTAAGEAELKRSASSTRAFAASGGASGALLGTLVRALVLNPVAGMAAGAGLGAGAGALGAPLSDHGLDDAFVEDLGEQLTAKSSALFVLVRDGDPEQVIQELSETQGTALRSSLSDAREAELRRALEEVPAPAAH